MRAQGFRGIGLRGVKAWSSEPVTLGFYGGASVYGYNYNLIATRRQPFSTTGSSILTITKIGASFLVHSGDPGTDRVASACMLVLLRPTFLPVANGSSTTLLCYGSYGLPDHHHHRRGHHLHRQEPPLATVVAVKMPAAVLHALPLL